MAQKLEKCTCGSEVEIDGVTDDGNCYKTRCPDCKTTGLQKIKAIIGYVGHFSGSGDWGGSGPVKSTHDEAATWAKSMCQKESDSFWVTEVFEGE